MALMETVIVLGVALALLGVLSVLGDAVFADTDGRFVAYLSGLLVGLALVGYVLLRYV